ncbi:MAG: hypothetical protein KGY65_00005, partial [Candidatus Thermoplasmatota archaeon]|nr:hypothetical protein [Candidatus Thermoplasmatota archaeon]
MQSNIFFSKLVKQSTVNRLLSIFFLFCLLSPLTSYGQDTCYSIVNESNEWNQLGFWSKNDEDGSFKGFWQTVDQSMTGVMNGSIRFARSDRTGWIQGIIIQNDSSNIYQLNVVVYNQFILGTINLDESSKTSIFFGSLTVEFPSFSFSLFIPQIGRVTGSGSYDGSFLPQPTGPYHVGVKSYHLIDESRDEWFTEDETDDRELMVKV